jgi:Cd2+/Zn2+-exporting ATPase
MKLHAELLPKDKVTHFETIQTNTKGAVAFVGDGINDAPALARADVGVAMGGIGSDAAIEAADVVIMDDKPTKVAKAIRIAKKTMTIVRQNIVLALGVKIAIMLLDIFVSIVSVSPAAMTWIAVFGDVGVAVIAILNSLRMMGA